MCGRAWVDEEEAEASWKESCAGHSRDDYFIFYFIISHITGLNSIKNFS